MNVKGRLIRKSYTIISGQLHSSLLDSIRETHILMRQAYTDIIRPREGPLELAVILKWDLAFQGYTIYIDNRCILCHWHIYQTGFGLCGAVSLSCFRNLFNMAFYNLLGLKTTFTRCIQIPVIILCILSLIWTLRVEISPVFPALPYAGTGHSGPSKWDFFFQETCSQL